MTRFVSFGYCTRSPPVIDWQHNENAGQKNRLCYSQDMNTIRPFLTGTHGDLSRLSCTARAFALAAGNARADAAGYFGFRLIKRLAQIR